MAQILVRHVGEPWQTPSVGSYVDERELQALVTESPELLTGQPLATVAEVTVSTGRVDILGLGADGSVTVVECKLQTNPQGRREVFGQVFSYAAAIARMSWSEFASTWEGRSGKTPADHVAEVLGTEIDADDFREQVEANLRSGAFTLLIVVDEITDELKQIIEYANTVTRADVTVLGLELQLAKEGDLQILIPRLWGESVAEGKRSRAVSAHRWSEESFDTAIADLDKSVQPAVKQLMAYGVAHGSRPYWGQGTKPRMAWYFKVGGNELSLYQVQLNPSGPAVAIHFSGMSKSKPLGHAVAAQLLADLKDDDVIGPHLASVDPTELNKVPTIPVTGVFDDPSVLKRFLATLDHARSLTLSTLNTPTPAQVSAHAPVDTA